MRKLYISALFLMSLVFSEKTLAQTPCHASFYLDSVNSKPFNAVIVNNSVTYLVPPDSAIYIWMWGDGTSSVGKNPSHTYTSAGSKYVYLLLESSQKTCSDSMMKVLIIDTLGGFHKTNGTFKVTVVSAAPAGINKNEVSGFVTLNPNIINENAKFTFSGIDKNASVQVDIFSYDGKNVLSSSEKLTGNILSLQTTSLQHGMYFAVVKSEGKTSMIKFIKN